MRAKIKAVLFTFVFMFSAGAGLAPAAVCRAEGISSFPYTFIINNLSYSGVYTGESSSGVPQGSGTFVTDDFSPRQYTYEGPFSSGLFDGEGRLTLENGDCLTCSFRSGLPQGSGRMTHPDGSYTTISFDGGFPQGLTETYTREGELSDYSFYYAGELISDLMDCARTAEYRELLRAADDRWGDVIRLRGVITDVRENQETCFFLIEDAEHNKYWGSYENGRFDPGSQAIMPTLRTGDELELYAFFCGISDYSAESGSGDAGTAGFGLPRLAPITALTDDPAFDRAAPSCRYAEALRFPYNYYGVSFTGTGTVEKANLKKQVAYFQIRDGSGDLYCTIISMSKLKEIPVPGDKVRFRGNYEGLYKEYDPDRDDYSSLYVLIRSDEISVTAR